MFSYHFLRVFSKHLLIFLTLSIIFGFTGMPVAAAAIDDPVRNYDVTYGSYCASLAVNKYNGKLLDVTDKSSGAPIVYHSLLRINEAEGGNGERYELNYRDILDILDDDPEDATISNKKQTQAVTYKECREYLIDHKNLEFDINKLSDDTAPHLCGFFSKFPLWLKIVTTVILVALVTAVICTAVSAGTAAAACCACCGVISTVNAIDRIWD